MGAWAIIKLMIRFLPEFINLVKYIQDQIDKGIEEAVIRKELSQITAAFALADKPTAARTLNDAFRRPN